MSDSATAMFNFFILILKQIPDFLLSEPICYIFGVVIGIFVVALFRCLLHLTD